MKALITGGGGFLGLHLGRKLRAEGWSVDLCDNFSRGAQDAELEAFLGQPGTKLWQGDLVAGDFLSDLPGDYEVIFHLAAIIGVKHVLSKPLAVLRDNIAMLNNVLDFAAGQGKLSRLVFASTSEVYAGTLQHFGMAIPTPESTPLAVTGLADARTSYMLSKIYGEALCLQSGIPCTIIRPHNIYGPRMGMAHVIPELLQKAHQQPANGSLEVSSVDHCRTFCYVQDAVELLSRVAQRPECQGQTLNIGKQTPEISIGDLAQLIIKCVGKPLTIKPLPATPGSPRRRCPDTGLATALTGYTAQVEPAQGIEWTYQWYLQKVFQPS